MEESCASISTRLDRASQYLRFCLKRYCALSSLLSLLLINNEVATVVIASRRSTMMFKSCHVLLKSGKKVCTIIITFPGISTQSRIHKNSTHSRPLQPQKSIFLLHVRQGQRTLIRDVIEDYWWCFFHEKFNMILISLALYSIYTVAFATRASCLEAWRLLRRWLILGVTVTVHSSSSNADVGKASRRRKHGLIPPKAWP